MSLAPASRVKAGAPDESRSRDATTLLADRSPESYAYCPQTRVTHHFSPFSLLAERRYAYCLFADEDGGSHRVITPPSLSRFPPHHIFHPATKLLLAKFSGRVLKPRFTNRKCSFNHSNITRFRQKVNLQEVSRVNKRNFVHHFDYLKYPQPYNQMKTL